MIVFGTEKHLGLKALVLILLRRLFGVFILFFVAVVFSFLKNPIVDVLSKNISADSSFSAVNIGNLASLFETGFYVIAGLLFAISILIGFLEYDFFTFTLEEFNLKVRRGILNREELSIPYRQVQNVDIDRSLFYQIIGVSKLTIVNASQDSTLKAEERRNIVLDPLDRRDAKEIREKLSHLIGIQVVRDDADESLRIPKVNSEMD